MHKYLFVVVFIVLFTMVLFAKNTSKKTPAQKSTSIQTIEDETLSITEHSINIKGSHLPYTAISGRLPITDTAGKHIASISFTSYTLKSKKIERRPLVFAFNGGPGASSIWLHLGAAGPKRIPFDSGFVLPEIDTLIDNQFTWLQFADLVFIDPIGTGYSRVAPKVNPDDYFNIERDVEVTAEFIRKYLTVFERWTSPIFIAGESYGTTRAAVLSDYLQTKQAIIPEGIILLSSILDFQAFLFNQGNELPYALIIPSYSAVAWFHNRLVPKLQKLSLPDLLKNVEQWIYDKYLPVLYLGIRIKDLQRNEVIDSLSLFTGLSKQFLEKQDFRVDQFSFAQQLLADNDSAIGILDGRMSSMIISKQNQFAYKDPSLYIVAGPFTALINDYMRRDLGLFSPLEYVFLSEGITQRWQWTSPTNQGFVNVSFSLKTAMSVNIHLRVFSCSGFYDLTTPFSAQQYVWNHLSMDSTYLKRITIKNYASHR